MTDVAASEQIIMSAENEGYSRITTSGQGKHKSDDRVLKCWTHTLDGYKSPAAFPGLHMSQWMYDGRLL